MCVSGQLKLSTEMLQIHVNIFYSKNIATYVRMKKSQKMNLIS